MEDKIFDSIIKEKLEQVQAPYQAAHWQRMAEKLDAAEFRPATDTRFDQLVKEKLSTPTEMLFASASWEQLALRMDQSHILIQRLRTSKVAELVILILTLLNLDAFTAGSEWQSPPAHQQITTSANQHTNNDTELNSTKPTQPGSESNSTPAEPTHPSVLPRSQNKKAADTRTRVQRNGSIYRPQSQPIVAAEQAPAATPGLIETLTSLAQSVLQPNPADAGTETNTSLASAVLTQGIDELPAVAITDLPERLAHHPLVKPMVKTAKQRARWQAIAHAGPDYVSVQGPNHTQTRGYTGGLHLARKKGKWSMETGVDYARLSYSAKPVREVLAGSPANGQTGRVLKTIDLDLVSVPVRIGRTIWKHKRTELSVAAGPQLIATAGISADYDHFYAPGSQPDPAPAQVPRVPPAPPINGLFEGGKLQENLHVAAQVALRAEHKLGSSNKSLFVEANAQALVTRNQLAKSGDHFSGVGLRTGLIAML